MTLLSGVYILAIWIPAHSYGVLIVYAILGGMVLGTYWAVSSPLSLPIKSSLTKTSDRRRRLRRSRRSKRSPVRIVYNLDRPISSFDIL